MSKQQQNEKGNEKEEREKTFRTREEDSIILQCMGYFNESTKCQAKWQHISAVIHPTLDKTRTPHAIRNRWCRLQLFENSTREKGKVVQNNEIIPDNTHENNANIRIQELLQIIDDL